MSSDPQRLLMPIFVLVSPNKPLHDHYMSFKTDRSNLTGNTKVRGVVTNTIGGLNQSVQIMVDVDSKFHVTR